MVGREPCSSPACHVFLFLSSGVLWLVKCAKFWGKPVLGKEYLHYHTVSIVAPWGHWLRLEWLRCGHWSFSRCVDGRLQGWQWDCMTGHWALDCFHSLCWRDSFWEEHWTSTKCHGWRSVQVDASLLNALISRCTDVHVQCVRNMRVDPSVYLSIICLSICLSSVCLSIYLNRYQIYIDLFIICPSFFLSVCTVYQSVHPFIHLSIYLLVCLFVCLSHGQISR